MSKWLTAVGSRSSRSGFTLLEVLVSLILGSMIVGGLLGLISLSLHYQHRLKEKSQLQPLLEAAAEEILADPRRRGPVFYPWEAVPTPPRSISGLPKWNCPTLTASRPPPVLSIGCCWNAGDRCWNSASTCPLKGLWKPI